MDGEFGSALQVVFKAASLAGFNKQLAEFVVPFTPETALITLPFLSTSILTTTIPSSSQLGCSFGFVRASLPAKL